jgi:hypothetical protein
MLPSQTIMGPRVFAALEYVQLEQRNGIEAISF